MVTISELPNATVSEFSLASQWNLTLDEENISKMATVSEKKSDFSGKIYLREATVSFCDTFLGCRRGSLQ